MLLWMLSTLAGSLKTFSDAAAHATADATNKIAIFLVILWVILVPLQNHLRITGFDHSARPVIL